MLSSVIAQVCITSGHMKMEMVEIIEREEESPQHKHNSNNLKAKLRNVSIRINDETFTCSEGFTTCITPCSMSDIMSLVHLNDHSLPHMQFSIKWTVVEATTDRILVLAQMLND